MEDKMPKIIYNPEEIGSDKIKVLRILGEVSIELERVLLEEANMPPGVVRCEIDRPRAGSRILFLATFCLEPPKHFATRTGNERMFLKIELEYVAKKVFYKLWAVDPSSASYGVSALNVVRMAKDLFACWLVKTLALSDRRARELVSPEFQCIIIDHS